MCRMALFAITVLFFIVDPRAQGSRNSARTLGIVKGQRDAIHGGRKRPPKNEVHVQEKETGIGKMFPKNVNMD